MSMRDWAHRYDQPSIADRELAAAAERRVERTVRFALVMATLSFGLACFTVGVIVARLLHP